MKIVLNELQYSRMNEQITLLGAGQGLNLQWQKTLNWDKHDWLQFISLTTGLVGSIPHPIAKALMGVSLATAWADAAIYLQEGKKYEAGLMFAFSVIPSMHLFKMLKNSKTFMKLGPKYSKDLMKKSAEGTLNTQEKKIAQELIQEIAPQSKVLATEAAKQTVKSVITAISKKGLKYLIKLGYMMYKLGIFGIKSGIEIAGVFYAWDILYLTIAQNDPKLLKDRRGNSLVQLKNYLTNNEKEVTALIIDEIEEKATSSPELSKRFLKINPDAPSNLDSLLGVYSTNKGKQ